GVLLAGLESLEKSIVQAFGTDKDDLVKILARWINTAAIEVLRLTEATIWLGEKGVQGVMALIVPFDALRFAVNYVWERLEAFEAALFEMAAKVPGVGRAFTDLAANARQLADEHKVLRDNTYNTLVAHQQLVSGQGALFDASAKVRTALHDAADAMTAAQAAPDAAAKSNNDLAIAEGAAAEAAKAAARAQAELNAQMDAMDAWSRKIKNTDPYAFLAQGMTKLLTMPPVMKEVGAAAIDMADDVKFAAEVVQKASVTWSEAMDLVRQGQGTMTGKIGAPTRPAGMSDSEWALMQSDPRQWELLHGFDWAAPHAGTGGAWSMGGGGTTAAAGTTVNQSVTVNTVAGDKHAIATVVKDALASEWRSSGVKG